VFIGMESIAPENLAAAKKYQNNIKEYRRMLLEWRKRKVITHAGYILGFPADTPESIERDIRTIQEELPIDILEFFVLTPLPGSADHRDMYLRGEWMDGDMNIYDSEHVTTKHPRMSAEEWQDIYERAWHLYYSPEHMETLIKRAIATNSGAAKVMHSILLYYGSYRHEGLHPLQCGILRRKVRTTRRPTLRRENPITFYPKRLWETVATWARVGAFVMRLELMRRRVVRELEGVEYNDLSLTPVDAVELIEADAESCESCDTAPAVVPLTIEPAKRAA